MAQFVIVIVRDNLYLRKFEGGICDDDDDNNDDDDDDKDDDDGNYNEMKDQFSPLESPTVCFMRAVC